MKIDLEKISIDNSGDNFQIKLNPGIEIPTNLYKYYYLNKNSVDVLKNNTLHFSHSFTMNDLMDGSFLLWDMEGFLNQYMQEHNIPEKEKIIYHKQFLKKLSDEFIKNIGVFCSCETYKNDLLWTHYTSESGFCIDINSERLLETLQNYQSYIFPINYGELKQIDLFKYSKKRIEGNSPIFDANIPIFYSFANKDEYWAYEKEWRFIIRDQSFGSITNPQTIISKEQNEQEKKALGKRNIPIVTPFIERIILATIFFNNKRFEAYSDNRYYFSQNDETPILIEFLMTLKDNYEDKIFQIDKMLKNGNVVRDIQYKINIVEVNDNYVEIKRTYFESEN
ncbi:DUF2971 domain-containing protein [Chryseobacterium arthrosphaerae]|uniref:DUF2971 domain-containing protein n=1 Tax=Chryseobacterium arthrosphaerae TaxID=651561 RepID=UPI0031D8F4AF